MPKYPSIFLHYCYISSTQQLVLCSYENMRTVNSFYGVIYLVWQRAGYTHPFSNTNDRSKFGFYAGSKHVQNTNASIKGILTTTICYFPGCVYRHSEKGCKRKEVNVFIPLVWNFCLLKFRNIGLQCRLHHTPRTSRIYN